MGSFVDQVLLGVLVGFGLHVIFTLYLLNEINEQLEQKKKQAVGLLDEKVAEFKENHSVLGPAIAKLFGK